MKSNNADPSIAFQCVGDKNQRALLFAYSSKGRGVKPTGAGDRCFREVASWDAGSSENLSTPGAFRVGGGRPVEKGRS